MTGLLKAKQRDDGNAHKSYLLRSFTTIDWPSHRHLLKQKAADSPLYFVREPHLMYTGGTKRICDRVGAADKVPAHIAIDRLIYITVLI